MSHLPANSVAVARRAMATRFEIVLQGDDLVALRAAGEEALSEIERLEARLSFYRATSDVSRINAQAAFKPVRVEPRLFRLLQQARRLSEETGGAFDITIAPLLRCWGFVGGGGRLPDPDELKEARARTGFHHVILNEQKFTVRFDREGVMIDLGAIGKGCAMECATEVLRQAGVTRAILHGGTSTICAIGQPLDGGVWKVAIEDTTTPASRSQAGDSVQSPKGGRDAPPPVLAVVPLRDESLSVSAVWGKAFESDGRILGHVLDPRAGEPVSNALLAAVSLPSATESDALSTALLVEGVAGRARIAALKPEAKTLVAAKDKGGHLVCESDWNEELNRVSG